MTDTDCRAARLTRWLAREKATADGRQRAHDWFARHPAALILARGEDGYPERLAELAGLPEFLAVEGAAQLLAAPRAVAIVGSRRATPYGRGMATELARQLGAAGVTVVSGFARGIDGAAHRGARGTAGNTVAVLGTGPDINYPAAHGELRRELLAGGGAVVTQYLPGTPALAANFPRRNAVISALAQAVVVVEAMEKSGAVLTAGLAGEQGRAVMAVPGRVGETSGGCHRLIRDGATLIESAAEVIVELGWAGELLAEAASADEGATLGAPALTAPERAGKMSAPALTAPERAVLLALDHECQVDALAIPGTDSAALAAALTRLELQGLVERRPGRCYALTAAGRAARKNG